MQKEINSDINKELADIRKSGMKFFRDIIVDETNILQWQGLIVPVIIEALVQLVNEPEPEHPLRADLAEEYTKDRKKFMKNAEEFTKKNAEKRPAD
ncbi:Ubiquitin-conjugating enzyme E2 L3 [Armadillidium vulgare]|nr:Ubiquitin-conjugating enzyme E2 L3 [Armadillidium vulgare]